MQKKRPLESGTYEPSKRRKLVKVERFEDYLSIQRRLDLTSGCKGNAAVLLSLISSKKKLDSVHSAIDKLKVEDYTVALLERLAKILMLDYVESEDDYRLVKSWVEKIAAVERGSVWGSFSKLFVNDGGEWGVWRNFRSLRRVFLVARLFSTDKTTCQENYLPYFSPSAFSADTIRILAQECKMFVSYGQMFRYLVYPASICLKTVNAVLYTWSLLQSASMRESCRLNSFALSFICPLRSLAAMPQMDSITSLCPLTIQCEELARFHASPLIPWMHCDIQLNSQGFAWDWKHSLIVEFYLDAQVIQRQQAHKHYISATSELFPNELCDIVAGYLISQISQLIKINPNTLITPDIQRLHQRYKHK